jgi:hypothetical protein
MTEFRWRLEPHVCRQCLGRVVSRQAEDGKAIVRCSNCGAQAVGEPAAMCCCWIRRDTYSGFRRVRSERPVPAPAPAAGPSGVPGLGHE